VVRGISARQFVNEQTLTACLLVLPSFVGFSVFFLLPALRGILISFTSWNLIQEPVPVGLSNYSKLLFTDADFWNSLGVTVAYVLWNIPLQTVLALFIAVQLDRVHTSTWLRGIFLIPWLIPNVIVGLVWLWLLDPGLGVLEKAVQAVGLGKQGFLGDPDTSIAWIAGINIWRYCGYTALLLFAGLKTIPRSLYEAATIDGAGELTTFFRITLPLLRPVLLFVLVESIVGSFHIFDTIAVTTQGGPAKATRVIYWYVYEYAFRRFTMGYAAAIASVLFGILIVLTITQFRLLRGNRSDLADYT
jgi:multiple sugar transport system permease protein